MHTIKYYDPQMAVSSGIFSIIRYKPFLRGTVLVIKDLYLYRQWLSHEASLFKKKFSEEEWKDLFVTVKLPQLPFQI